MVIDSIIVGVVVTAAAAYLAWMVFPRRRKPAVACSACPRTTEVRR
jgi:hypothetical protein